MAKNVYSDEQSKYIFDTLVNANDKLASLQELAGRYLTDTKSLKLHIHRKDSSKYQEWFGVPTDSSSNLTKKQMLETIFDIVGTEESAQELILDSQKSSSLPKGFMKEIHKHMVGTELKEWDRFFEGQRKQLHHWKIPNGMFFGIIGSFVFFGSFIIFLFSSLQETWGNVSLGLYIVFLFLFGLYYFRQDYLQAFRDLQHLKMYEEDLIEVYEASTNHIPEDTLKEIYEERWLTQRQLLKDSYDLLGVGKTFVGFEEEPQEPKIYGYYDFISHHTKPFTFIWNRAGVGGMVFRHIDKRIDKKSEWLDKQIEAEKENENLWKAL